MDCRETTCWSSDYYDEVIYMSDLQISSYPKNFVLRKLRLLCLFMRLSMRMKWKNWNPSRPIAVKIQIQVSLRINSLNNETKTWGIFFTTFLFEGFCYGKMEQWYYNATSSKCSVFQYTGCAGNKNNFATETECLNVCHPLASTLGVEKFKSQIKDEYDDEEILLGDDPSVGDKRDCLMSLWSDWSPCSSSCGRGWMTMMRSIVSPPMNGGRPCPKKMIRYLWEHILPKQHKALEEGDDFSSLNHLLIHALDLNLDILWNFDFRRRRRCEGSLCGNEYWKWRTYLYIVLYLKEYFIFRLTETNAGPDEVTKMTQDRRNELTILLANETWHFLLDFYDTWHKMTMTRHFLN